MGTFIMLNNWRFRFAVSGGVTVVYPVGSFFEPCTIDRIPGTKFAISGKNEIRLIYPVEGLDSLTPEAIELRKSEVLSLLRGREQFQPNSLLNSIARGIGLAADWGGYKNAYREKLLPFLKEKGLRKHVNLLGTEEDPFISLSYRQVADRLFASGAKVPFRLFTGSGFDYWLLLELARKQPDLHIKGTLGEKITGSLDRTFPPNCYHISDGEVEFSFVEISHFNNLIGDQLCDVGSAPQKLTPRVYNADPNDVSRLQRGLEIFQRLLRLTKCGWVNVIPYNDNLIFLSDGIGGYDFVFKNLRDEILSVTTTDDGDAVKQEDKDQAFLAWSYFQYISWRELDEHESEKQFYADGGSLSTYPGSIAVLRDYLARNGQYVQQEIKTSAIVHLTGLVSIRAFKKYLRDVQKIAKAKGDDPWLYANGNRQEEKDSPVAVTWEEAADYARWMSSKGKSKCRLPTEKEYRETFTSLIPEKIIEKDVMQALAERLVDFISPEGIIYDKHPPYMQSEEFAKLTMRYRMPVPMEGGVVRSAYFGEWLEPAGAAINGLFFCAQFEVAMAHKIIVSPDRARLPCDTTGKYKSMKIGFRLALLD